MNQLDFSKVLPTRNKIFELEDFCKSLPTIDIADADKVDFAQVELKLVHYHSEGVYARELHIPKGALVIGEIHKYKNLNILSKGKISVSTDDGLVTVEAPFTVVSPSGTKRYAFAHEDCVWTTILRTDEINIDKIEKHFVAKSEQEFLEFCGQQTLALESKSDDLSSK